MWRTRIRQRVIIIFSINKEDFIKDANDEKDEEDVQNNVRSRKLRQYIFYLHFLIRQSTSLIAVTTVILRQSWKSHTKEPSGRHSVTWPHRLVDTLVARTDHDFYCLLTRLARRWRAAAGLVSHSNTLSNNQNPISNCQKALSGGRKADFFGEGKGACQEGRGGWDRNYVHWEGSWTTKLGGGGPRACRGGRVCCAVKAVFMSRDGSSRIGYLSYD